MASKSLNVREGPKAFDRRATMPRRRAVTLENTVAHNTVRLHRVLHAPAERIYRAFLDPAALAKWLPPNGFTGTVHQLDARVGGTYRMVARVLEGAEQFAQGECTRGALVFAQQHVQQASARAAEPVAIGAHDGVLVRAVSLVHAP